MSRRIGKFTNKYRLGFGSYADKPVMPYILPGHEKNPCVSEHAVCSSIYSYWHHLRLTDDIQRFITKVSKISVSFSWEEKLEIKMDWVLDKFQVNNSLVTGNADNLEGALDGIVQTIVCTEQVGWEHQARKIILVVTDGHLHFAGDGKVSIQNMITDNK